MQQISDYLRLVSELATIFASISVVVVIIEYRNKSKQKKRNQRKIIDTLRKQLEIIGSWASYKSDGYSESESKDLIENNRKTWGNPFHIVYDLDNSQFGSINLMPGMEDLDDEIKVAIFSLNQEIVSFRSFLDDIRWFKYSRSADANILLHLKLNGIIDKPLTPEEEVFSTKLVEMYASLHLKNIGDKQTRRMHYWCSKLDSILEEKQKDCNRPCQ